MSEIEKITTNVSVVDLGQIDLLVEQGYYSNRTDFFRTAVRNQLAIHNDAIKQVIVRKNRVVGIMKYNRAELEKYIETGEKLDIKVVGMLSLAPDVTPELIYQTINSVEVHGVIRAQADVKEAVQKLIDKNFFDAFK